jgi:hypothetical protein
VSKSISILHYTNNTISNLYGEFFYIDTTNGKTLDIYMPDLMYHRRDYASGMGTEQGMRFKASGSTYTIGTSDVQYIELMEDPTMISSMFTPKVVGKVFPQLKVVVIEDDELVAAMSYKSNRNWTLPELAASIVAPDGITSTGVLGVGETMYLTYMLENDLGYGLQNSLSCQEYIKLTNNSSSPKDVAFRMAEIDMLPYMRKIEAVGYDGLGFYATKFKLVYQIVSDAATRPASGSWKVYDFTSTAITTGAKRKQITYDKSYFASNESSLTLDGGVTRLQDSPESRKMVFEYLKQNSPDMSKVFFKTWTDDDHDRALQIIRHALGDESLFSNLMQVAKKKNYKWTIKNNIYMNEPVQQTAQIHSDSTGAMFNSNTATATVKNSSVVDNLASDINFEKTRIENLANNKIDSAPANNKSESNDNFDFSNVDFSKL